MRLIDADILYPDSVSIKGDRLCISQSQIANAPTVDVLDKIRSEIDQITDTMGVSYNQYVSKIDVLQIIDKYKEEARGKA